MICATCGKEFEKDPHKPRQKNCTFCGNHVISRKRNKTTKYKVKATTKGEFKCPCCGEYKSVEKYCFCEWCRDNIQLTGVSDDCLGFRVIA